MLLSNPSKDLFSTSWLAIMLHQGNIHKNSIWHVSEESTKSSITYRLGQEIIYDKILSIPPSLSLHNNFSICFELRRNVFLLRKILSRSTPYCKRTSNLDFNNFGLLNSRNTSYRLAKFAATSSAGIWKQIFGYDFFVFSVEGIFMFVHLNVHWSNKSDDSNCSNRYWPFSAHICRFPKQKFRRLWAG